MINSPEAECGYLLIKITVSLIKADVGAYPGLSTVHPALIETAEFSTRHEQATVRVTSNERELVCFVEVGNKERRNQIADGLKNITYKLLWELALHCMAKLILEWLVPALIFFFFIGLFWRASPQSAPLHLPAANWRGSKG